MVYTPFQLRRLKSIDIDKRSSNIIVDKIADNEYTACLCICQANRFTPALCYNLPMTHAGLQRPEESQAVCPGAPSAPPKRRLRKQQVARATLSAGRHVGEIRLRLEVAFSYPRSPHATHPLHARIPQSRPDRRRTCRRPARPHDPRGEGWPADAVGRAQRGSLVHQHPSARLDPPHSRRENQPRDRPRRADRLGIPLLDGEDAIHGHSFWPGATIFPTQLAIAASWDPRCSNRSPA